MSFKTLIHFTLQFDLVLFVYSAKDNATKRDRSIDSAVSHASFLSVQMSRNSVYLNLLWSHTSDKTPRIPPRPASDCIVLVRQARCSVPPPHPCPAGPRADGTVSGADVDNQGSQSVSRPVHSSTVPHWGFGPEWDSPDNHPSPTSSCTTQGASGLAVQLGHGIPGGDAVVVLCREDVSHTACRLVFYWSVRKHLLMFNHLRQFAFYSLS